MNFNITSDFVSGFWNMYVIVLVLVSVIGCGVFLWMQDKAKFVPGETTGHVWDETLAEYSNPLPNWWRWLFYGTVVFSLVYLALYPGMGNFAGSFGWTMRGQYDQEMKKADEQYGPKFNQFLKMDVAAVAANPEAREMGGRLFQTYCAQCHGSDAKGAKSFPNLADHDWLWGGSPEKIKETIAKGRDAVMTPKGTKPDMDGEQVKDVVHYVRSLSGLSADAARVERGKALYPQACVACHGPDGKGNPEAGFPNLTDKTWLYTSQEAEMVNNVTTGLTNRMPAFGEFLGEAKVHLLTAYVYGLGGGQAGAAAADTGPMAVLEGNTAKVYFATGKADMGAEAQSVIQGLLDLAKANPNARFAVSGFHDATGDRAVNEELAKNRAVAVRDALKAAGVAEDRIELRKPAETTGTGGNKEARRVEASII
ncbi:MAG: cytochrome-c oxidase, cbb3-type subunit III [Betaproteobacteria bacterium]|nr:cytochrome-c oxidase, cbb3-type subunit III [Betaproteobacteria bacterium]